MAMDNRGCDNAPPRILHGELALTKRKLGRLHDHSRAFPQSLLPLSLHVGHPHRDGVRNHCGVWRSAVPASVSDDHSSVANGQLRAVVFTDTYLLDEAERRSQPRHGVANAGVAQDGNHGCRRDGAIGSHSAI